MRPDWFGLFRNVCLEPYMLTQIDELRESERKRAAILPLPRLMGSNGKASGEVTERIPQIDGKESIESG